MKTIPRKWFVLAGVAVLVLAAAGVIFYGQRIVSPSSRMEAGAGHATRISQAASSAAPPAPNMNQPRLAPVQLTPQRLQSIGVTFGAVEEKPVSDEIRVTGNVVVDERRVAYVQTRFPGWIRHVYVDANYQYVHKGQPLFTIYSPDLVTTEHEYLLAKQNAAALRGSSLACVA